MRNHSLPISISSTTSAIEPVPLSRVPHESMQHVSRTRGHDSPHADFRAIADEFFEQFSPKGYPLAISVYSMTP